MIARALLIFLVSLVLTAGTCYAALIFGRWIWT